MTRPLMRKSRPSSALASSIRPAASSLAHARRAHRPPAGHRRGDGVDLEARATQRLDVAAACLAETKSLADHHVPRPQRAHQDALDESRRLESREPRVEAQHAQLVDARRRDARGLVAQPHQPRRRRSRLEMLFRLGLEADHGRRQPQLAAAFPQCRQDRLVPEMQAVEVADRDRAPGVRVTTGFETTSNQHGPAGSGIRARQL